MNNNIDDTLFDLYTLAELTYKKHFDNLTVIIIIKKR